DHSQTPFRTQTKNRFQSLRLAFSIERLRQLPLVSMIFHVVPAFLPSFSPFRCCTTVTARIMLHTGCHRAHASRVPAAPGTCTLVGAGDRSARGGRDHPQSPAPQSSARADTRE